MRFEEVFDEKFDDKYYKCYVVERKGGGSFEGILADENLYRDCFRLVFNKLRKFFL